MIMATKRQLKIDVFKADGSSGVITLDNPVDNIDGAKLGSAYDAFEAVGFTIRQAYYVTTTTNDPVIPIIE